MSICGAFSPESLFDEAKLVSGWECIRFNGWCNREKVKYEMAQSIAGVVLFYDAPNNRASQPNNLFEYMAGRLPVIASNFPCWRKIIEENSCGVVVDPQDPDDVANAMRTFIMDREKAEIMGANGRRAVKTKFNWEVESEKLRSVYAKVYDNGKQ